MLSSKRTVLIYVLFAFVWAKTSLADHDNDYNYYHDRANAFKSASSTEGGQFGFSFSEGVLRIDHTQSKSIGFVQSQKEYVSTNDVTPLLVVSYKRQHQKPNAKPIQLMLDNRVFSGKGPVYYTLGDDVTEIAVEIIRRPQDTVSVIEDREILPIPITAPATTKVPRLNLKDLPSRSIELLDPAEGTTQELTLPFLAPDHIRARAQADGKIIRSYYLDTDDDIIRSIGYFELSLHGKHLKVTHFARNHFGFYALQHEYTPSPVSIEPNIVAVIGGHRYFLDTAALQTAPSCEFELPLAPADLSIYVPDMPMYAAQFSTKPLTLRNSVPGSKDRPTGEPTVMELRPKSSTELDVIKDVVVLPYVEQLGLIRNEGAFEFSWEDRGILAIKHQPKKGNLEPNFEPEFSFRIGHEMLTIRLTDGKFKEGKTRISIEAPVDEPSIDIFVPSNFTAAEFTKHIARLTNHTLPIEEAAPTSCEGNFTRPR